jgi:hypothetical protein
VAGTANAKSTGKSKSKALVGSAALSARARNTLIISVVVTLGLFYLPYAEYINRPLVLLSTLVHELGHGVAAVLVGGTFHKFQMWWDGSGVATWSGNVGGAGRAFVSAGGLVGPAIGAMVALICARRTSTARYCMGTVGGLMLLAELLVVRNGFGLAFVAVFAAVCIALAIYASDDIVQLSLVFLGVQLALAVYSRNDYLWMRYADTAQGKMPSDVEHMSMAMGLPYWFWGGLCTVISAVCLVAGAWLFLRGAGPIGRKSKV